jgi:hypothetical protein
MDRRALLQGLLTLPIASVLNGGIQAQTSDHNNSQAKSPVTLRIVLDGAFTVVLRADNFWNVEVFTPRSRMHQFRFFGNQMDKMYKQDSYSGFRPHHFALRPDGLKGNAGPPAINPCLSDFSAVTDRWCRDKYAATINFPPPKNITLIPPMSHVVFSNRRDSKKIRKAEACLTSNYVLEYEITDPAKIKMGWQQDCGESKEFGPMRCQELFDRYTQECNALARQQKNAKDPNTMRMPPQCYSEATKAFLEKFQFLKSDDFTFFFGVGLPPGTNDMQHPVTFFNSTLDSFPDLKRDFAIESTGKPCEEACTSGSTAQHKSQPQASLREVSSVVDCHVAGVLVTQPTPP